MAVDVFFILQVFGIDECLDLVVLGNVDEILDGPSLGDLPSFWDLVGAQPKAPALFSEKEHVVVVGGREEVFDEIFIARGSAPVPHSSSALCAILGQRGSLHVTRMGDGDDDLFIRDHILDAQVATGVVDLGAALIPVLLLHFMEFVLDDLEAQTFIRKHLLIIGNAFHQIIVFALDLVAFQTCEALQTQVQYGACLCL